MCVKAASRKYRNNNIEKVKVYDRNRPNHKERIEQNSQKAKAKRLEGDPDFIEYERNRVREYRSRNPEKYEAQCAVNNAVRDGLLIKPCRCERCESTTNIQGHHWSYLEEHWLDVIWLCSRCHADEHKTLRELGRDID